jgi:hypothetical protein
MWQVLVLLAVRVDLHFLREVAFPVLQFINSLIRKRLDGYSGDIRAFVPLIYEQAFVGSKLGVLQNITQLTHDFAKQNPLYWHQFCSIQVTRQW